MGKCKTDENLRWKSKVKGADDGKISIREVNGSGDIDGKHEKSGRDLVGKCHEPSDQRPKLRFVVPHNGHLYVGVLINDDRIEGFRFNLADLCSEIDGADRPLNGDEDWVAVKGT